MLAIASAVAAIAIGAIESYRLFHLISLEQQGKCDFVPCANQSTYYSLALFLALALSGLVVLGFVLLGQIRKRA